MVLGGQARESAAVRESRRFRYKLLKTATLIFFWVTSGLFHSLEGTTLVDFKEKLNTDFDKLGTVMVCRKLGNMFGCFVGCLLRDKAHLPPELILGVAAAIGSLTNSVKPWSGSVEIFGALDTAAGFVQSCANTVNNALLLGLWGKAASTPVHALHFGYGLGGFLGPLLAKDFLSVRCPDSRLSSSNGTNVSSWSPGPVEYRCENSTESDPVILHESRLEIPFSIVGALLAMISMVLLTFYFLERCSGEFRLTYTEPEKTIEKSKDINKTKNCYLIFKTFHFRFAVGLFFLYMCINSFEGVVYHFLFTFTFESGIGFSKPEAAYLSSAYWGSYTLSRLAASIIAHFLTVKVMIFVEMLGSLGSLLSFLFSGFQSKTGMWVSACLLGVFSAPIWPSGLAWADRYITVRASVVAATDVGAGIGGSVCTWVAGHLVEKKQVRSYLYLASSGCACAFLILTIMQTFAYRHGDRYGKRSKVEHELNEQIQVKNHNLSNRITTEETLMV